MVKYFMSASVFLVLVLIMGGCASMAGPVQGVRDWIGDAGSPVSHRPLFRVYTSPSKSTTYTPVYRAGDNDINYYHHTNKPAPPRVNREATYGYYYWELNPKASRSR